ncbi:NADPH2:quinone reductase [Devosia sp. UYZn731]|uniref:quinone oxidoreductase family protein n=1 Tax=Devosia sp. UYZn731 TaxID=3156345 RepID=UPI003392BC5A
MKAIVIREFGDASKLLLDDLPIPNPAAGEISIEVAYAGVGFVDTLVRAGKFDFATLPLIPGIEVSGYVRALGDGVSGFVAGQRVAALLTDFSTGGMAGYAEVVNAKAALSVALGPEDDLATVAGIIANGATAFMAMEGMTNGASIAISGASGGLGQALIAAAVAAGAREIIAFSSNRARYGALRAAGATEVVTGLDFIRNDLDAAFDCVGGAFRSLLLGSVKPGGRLLLLGNASGEDTALSGDRIWLSSVHVEGLSTGGLSHLTPGRIATAAGAALRAARSRPRAFQVLELCDAATAHQLLEDREGPGKFILRVGGQRSEPATNATNLER